MESQLLSADTTLEELLLSAAKQLDLERAPTTVGWNQIDLFAKAQTIAAPELLDKLNFNSIHASERFSQLIQASKIYFDRAFSKFSTVPLQDYYLFNDRFAQLFPGYQLDQRNSLMPITAPSLNFKDTTELLLTPMKDIPLDTLKVFEQLLKDNGGDLLLDCKEKIRHIPLASFPRGGSSFTRKLLEQITGIATGSTIPLTLLPDYSVMFQGLKGEAVMDDRAWILKSHHPNQPLAKDINNDPFNVNKSIVLTRNPLDIMISWWHFFATITMNQSVANDHEFPQEFADLLPDCVSVYKRFSTFWKEKAESKQIPIFFLRYEDLVSAKEATLIKLFEFLFERDISGTYLEERIKVVSKNADSGRSYQPRDAGKQNTLKHFTEEQLEMMKAELKEVILFFGFHNSDRNPHSIFDYKDLTPEEELTKFGFEKTNLFQKEVFLVEEAKLENINVKPEPNPEAIAAALETAKVFTKLAGKFVIRE